MLTDSPGKKMVATDFTTARRVLQGGIDLKSQYNLSFFGDICGNLVRMRT